MKIQIFDPPMCCSTGVCGPSVDPELVRFSADLDWLRHQGIEVERHNLSQEPAVFVNNPIVKGALASEGNACLPLTMVDGDVLCKGYYPNREALAELASRGTNPPVSRKSAQRLPLMQAAPSGGCCGSSAETSASTGKKGGGSCCC